MPYGDNPRIVKLEYRSPSIYNRENIEFNNFELKTDADVRALLNTFFRFETKIILELKVTIPRLVDDILNILKCPPVY